MKRMWLLALVPVLALACGKENNQRSSRTPGNPQPATGPANEQAGGGPTNSTVVPGPGQVQGGTASPGTQGPIVSQAPCGKGPCTPVPPPPPPCGKGCEPGPGQGPVPGQGGVIVPGPIQGCSSPGQIGCGGGKMPMPIPAPGPCVPKGPCGGGGSGGFLQVGLNWLCMFGNEHFTFACDNSGFHVSVPINQGNPRPQYYTPVSGGNHSSPADLVARASRGDLAAFGIQGGAVLCANYPLNYTIQAIVGAGVASSVVDPNRADPAYLDQVDVQMKLICRR